jgi:hypothetical protein
MTVKLSIEMDEREEIALSMKEMLRQSQALRETWGDDALDQSLQSDLGQQISATLMEVMEGHVTPAEAQTRLEESERQIEERFVEGSDDPATVMSHRAEKEAELKGLPSTAQLLVCDANKQAAAGVSKEEWIAEVLQGHADDDAAQLGCLACIVRLWSEGLLPWPAGTEKA